MPEVRIFMVNVVSTFSGCGGSSLGYKRAGCKVLLAIDFEDRAVKTYKLNFPETEVWKRNIREVTGKEILKKLGLERGELDILDGSPPCTPFSLSGKRENGWNIEYKHSSESVVQRSDDLFFEFIRLVGEVKPRVFVAENVRGMVTGKAKGYFNSILRNMKLVGYDVQVFDVDAKHFEVAQSRPRIVFIGVRNDIAKKGMKPPLKTSKPISFHEAVKDIVNTEIELKWSSIDLDTKTGKLLKVTKQGESLSKHHPTGSYFNTTRIDPMKPIPTVTTKVQIAHPYENRWLTISELKRCASFPDDFKFLSMTDAWVRIGNSVPPNLIKNIALYVRKNLLN